MINQDFNQPPVTPDCKTTNQFGRVGSIFALIGLVFGVISLLSVLSIFNLEPSRVTLIFIFCGIFVSVIGLGFAIAGLFEKPQGLAILGVVTSLVSCFICFVAFGIGVFSIKEVRSIQHETTKFYDGAKTTTITKTLINDNDETVDTVRHITVKKSIDN